MTRKFSGILVLAALLVFATTAQAVLFRVGPNDTPSPPGSGFPFWYQDTQGLALDLCIPRTQAQLDAGVCLIFPRAVDPVAGIDLPIVFPTNFPDEAFWWNATAVMDLGGGNGAVLVLALEAAFGGGAVAVGDQVTFGRLRIVVDAPVNGNYTVTTPYGVKEFPGVTAGKRAITFTSDIGIGAPGDFTGALKSEVGPFLRATDTLGGTIPSALFVLDGDSFLSDAATPVFVTGSPAGTNYFEVCTDASGGFPGLGPCVTVNQFTLMGKVHTAPIPSPLIVDRATYARSSTPNTTHVDVFATASPAIPGAPTPVLSFGDSGGTNLMPSKRMNGPTNLGQYYGQSIPTNPAAIPAGVIVTNSVDNPPSSISQALVDEVTITQASYDPAGGTLTITATSSDKGLDPPSTIVPPQLFAIGLPGSTGSVALAPVVGSPDPAEQRIAYTIPTPLPPGGAVPPFAVNVSSSAGGLDTEVVSTVTGGTFAAGGPIAVDDSVSVPAGTPSVTIPVLANDFGYDPTTVRITSLPKPGSTATPDPTTGDVTYTFNNTTFVGDDFFSYTVFSASGLESNVAFVVVTTTAPVGGPVPIAVNDGPFSVATGQSLTINVLANDSGNGGTLDPASVLIATAPGSGTATPNPTGTITYTAGATTGPVTFQYTVANTNGNVSAPATVTVTVTSVQTVTITAAQYKGGGAPEWRVDGTTAPVVANTTITVTLFSSLGANKGTIGTATADAVGAWRVRLKGAGLPVALSGDVVRATSSITGSIPGQLTVTVR